MFKPWSDHIRDVEKLRQALLDAPPGILRLRRGKGQSHTTRSPKQKDVCCLTAPLDQVLAVSRAPSYVVCEPFVTFEALVEATLELGLMPAVVPEFKGITVGGALMGAALESSSFKQGQFNDCCEEATLLLPNGELVTVSLKENRALFEALAGSYGTLAWAVSLKIRLIEAPKSVKVSVQRFCQVKGVLEGMKTATESAADYVEGMIFNERDCPLITGHFSNESAEPLRDSSPWFYQQIASGSFTLTLKDYLFRYDRGAYWMGAYLNHPMMMMLYGLLRRSALAARLMKKLKERLPSPVVHPPTPLFRHLFGKALSSESLYRGLHSTPEAVLAKLFFIQDCYIPYENAERFLAEVIPLLGLFPLWLCPIRNAPFTQMLSPHESRFPLLINIGLYGTLPTGMSVPLATKKVEELVIRAEGRKMLYSQSYYTAGEFWSLYDRTRYKKLRSETGAEGRLPDLYDKVVRG